MSCRHLMRLILAGVMAVAGAAPAVAQRAAGQDGRALDASPQVGSGGTNRLENQIDFAARNALITGNVPGNKAFRGRIDYGAPGDLRVNTGSNDLFNFRANSLPSSAPALQIQGSYTGGDPSIFIPRENSGTLSGDVNNSNLIQANRQVPVLRGGDFSPAQIVAAQSIPLGNRVESTPLGLRQQPDGTILQLQATPLLGVRQVRPTIPTVSTEVTDLTGLQRVPDIRDLPVNLRFDTEIQPAEPGQVAPTDPQRQLGEQLRGQTLDRSTSRAELGSVLGERLNASRLGTQQARLDQQVQQYERLMFGQTDTRTYQPGQDVYQDLLARMRGEEVKPKNQPEPTNQVPTINVPTVEELRKAEEERRTAVEAARRARGLGPTPTTGADTGAAPAPAAGAAPDQPGTGAGRTPATQGADPARGDAIGGLVDKLDYELPRVVTLAGEKEDRLNKLMKAAEEDLAAQRFFDAENKYRQVSEQGDNPLARVGLVHAQLSAGMVRAAAANLRTLFERHPELIAARYDARLLPPQDRLDFVHTAISRAISETPRGDAALTLAYLGYQLDSKQNIRYGLAVAQARNPQDPLLPLLRQIWLDERDDAAPAPAAAPAGAGAGPAGDQAK